MAVTEQNLEAEVIHLRQQLSAADEVRQRVAEIVARITAPAPLAQVRDALNEVGIQRARATLREAPDLVANAKVSLRQAQDAERAARDAYADALLEAEWELATHFVVRSNKQWLAVESDGTAVAEADQRSLTADEKKAWIAHHAAQAPAVKTAASALRAAEENTAAARDDVALAEARLSVAKHDLDAAAVQLRAFTLALPREDFR